MNEEIRALEPKALWNKFADLNAVPRPSKKEERVIEFMKNFGNQLGLETMVDEVGNVIIRKPASPGMEDRQAIVLQSHLDMVHQKNNDTEFDFDTQGIEMYVDGDWVKAKGTTLGADNGLGVATIMAILESKEIQHPALEALFTIDEETGMTGAMGLKPGVLEGEILLNLDTEEDDEIGIGCAGGIDITAKGSYEEVNPEEKAVGFEVKINGLQGGHSGMDIIKGLGNANKLMNRVLFEAFDKYAAQISEINGGGLRNAIPRESVAKIAVSGISTEDFLSGMEKFTQTIKNEYVSLEPKLKITITSTEVPQKVMSPSSGQSLLRCLYAAHNGVFGMSPDIEGLVETSNNIAKVHLANGKIEILCLTRSSVESSKMDLANGLRAAFELGDLEVQFSGAYPGWTPNPNSEVVKLLDELYQKLNNEEPLIEACHAGLECGIIGKNYPEMEMVSFGPTIRGAHSPDEKASISSAQKYWDFVLEILKNIPKK